MTLAEVELGSKIVLKEIRGTRVFVERLYELGLVPGTQAYVKHRLPFGGPIIIRANSTILALRREDSNFIEVSLL